MTRRVRTGFLAVGDAQARITTQNMRSLVRRAIHDPDFVLWARDEIMKLSPGSIRARDWAAVARAIRRYVAQHIIFVPDPVGVEDLTPPLRHMAVIKARGGRPVPGDCDDAATLSAAMGLAMGIPAQFVVRAFWTPQSPYQHVFTVLRPRGSTAIIDVDTTRNAQKFPPSPTREFRVTV